MVSRFFFLRRDILGLDNFLWPKSLVLIHMYINYLGGTKRLPAMPILPLMPHQFQMHIQEKMKQVSTSAVLPPSLPSPAATSAI